MKKSDIIRAWRDQDAYLSLDGEDLARLPASPAGPSVLDDEDLRGVAGGAIAAGTHYSFCEPTASWCDDCSSKLEDNFSR